MSTRPTATRAYRPEDAERALSCARDPEMSEFFSAKVEVWQRRGLCRVFVLPSEDDAVLGFYALSMGAAAVRELSAPDPTLEISRLPACLIGKLARDDAAPRGTGALLLADALRRTSRIASEVGCAGLFLHAKNELLVSYYERYGFEPMKRTTLPRAMFLAMESVKRAIEQAPSPPDGPR